MENLIVYGATLTAFVYAIMEVIKRTQRIPVNYLPAIALLLGGLVGLLSAYVPEMVEDISILGHVVAGLASGLMASGVYENITNREGYTKPPNQSENEVQ